MLRAVGRNSEQSRTGEFAHVALLAAARSVDEHPAGLPVARAIGQFHQRAVRFIEGLQPESDKVPGPPNRVMFVCVEPADVEVALSVPTHDRLGLQHAQVAGNAERLIECGRRHHLAVPSRPKRLGHPPADLASRLAGVMGGAVAEILPHNRRLNWPGTVVLPVPLRVAIERLSLLSSRRGASRPVVLGKTNHEQNRGETSRYSELLIAIHLDSSKTPSAALSSPGTRVTSEPCPGANLSFLIRSRTGLSDWAPG